MALTASDWEVIRSTKVIDYTGGDHDNSPTYATVIELHRFLQDLADDPYHTPADDDEVDISTLLPSTRSTDNIVTLINGYTLGPRAVEHLYDGSIIEAGGDTIYDGIVNYGNASVQIHIIQNGEVLSDDWWNYNGAGLNDDAGAGISHRFMLKVRNEGADIDARKLIGITREFNSTDGYTYAEFKINGTSRGNNVLALVNADDINNDTAIATVAGWTSITNTGEGLQLIDVDNDGSDEDYWSEWDAKGGGQTINQFYERMKWLTKAPIAEDSNTDSTSDFIVDNATITGAAQSFAVGSNAMLVTKVSFPLKKTLAPTGDVTASIYSITGSHGSTAIPNALQGSVSDPVEAATLTTTYERTVFHFPTPVSLSASTNYCVVIEHADGDASNYVQVEGLASSGTHGGNRSHNTAGWTAVAADDLAFEVFTSPSLNGIPGVLLRGVTHAMSYDAETGAPATTHNEHLVWGTLIVDTNKTGTFQVGEVVQEDLGPDWVGRVLAYDDTNSSLLVYVDSGTVAASGEAITGQTSGATMPSTDSRVNPVGSGTIGGDLLVLAMDDEGATGYIYGQLMKGSGPKDNDILYDATDLTDSYTLDIDAIERTISTPFCGASTGSALIGSYGFGVEYADLTQNDKLTPLGVGAPAVKEPPNLVTQSVGGLETTGSSEDYVFVAPWDGVTTDVNGDPAVDTGQMLVATSALTTANVGTVTVGNGTETAIPSDTPSAGWIRVVDDDGYHRRLKYSSWSGVAFTIDTTWHTSNDNQNDFDGATGSGTYQAGIGNDVYVTYIDEISTSTPMTYQAVHTAGTRDLVVVVRNGNTGYLIKQFISEWSFTSASQTLNAIHTSDT